VTIFPANHLTGAKHSELNATAIDNNTNRNKQPRCHGATEQLSLDVLKI